MIRPCCPAVRALKFFTKSMMLTPAWPSAGPTGGAGVAAPAGICNFTIPMTFFAIILSGSLLRPSSDLLHLREVQLDRRLPAKDRDHDLQGVAVEIDLVHRAREVV